MLFNTKSREWFGTDYTMNIYRGCNLGCIYCDSRSECYRIKHFDEVETKESCIVTLKNELTHKKSGVIGFGSMSDPYNHLEKRLQLTRQALTLIEQYRFGAVLCTKSQFVLRDLDLLMQINTHSSLLVGFSITTCDDKLGKQLERHASLTSQRFASMKSLADQGIYTGTLLMPVLPFITDNRDNIIQIIHETHAHGGKFIFPWLALTLRDKQKDYFYHWLVKLFPNMKSLYNQTFQNNYVCYPPNYTLLQSTFIKECNKLGIKYQMADIIADYKHKQYTPQLNLF